MSSFNTSQHSYPFLLYQSAYRPGILGGTAPRESSPFPAPPSLGPLSGSQTILYMESNCHPGTEVGPSCAPSTALQIDICLQNDHTSGTSVGIRKCL